jgi:hypothetical protein
MVVLANRCAGILADIEGLVEGDTIRDGTWQLFTGHLVPIHAQRGLATLAHTPACVVEVKGVLLQKISEPQPLVGEDDKIILALVPEKFFATEPKL